MHATRPGSGSNVSFVPWILCAVIAGVAALATAEDEDLRGALGDDRVSDKWIYDDLDAGFAAARESGRPLLVVFR